MGVGRGRPVTSTYRGHYLTAEKILTKYQSARRALRPGNFKLRFKRNSDYNEEKELAAGRNSTYISKLSAAAHPHGLVFHVVQHLTDVTEINDQDGGPACAQTAHGVTTCMHPRTS